VAAPMLDYSKIKKKLRNATAVVRNL